MLVASTSPGQTQAEATAACDAKVDSDGLARAFGYGFLVVAFEVLLKVMATCACVKEYNEGCVKCTTESIGLVVMLGGFGTGLAFFIAGIILLVGIQTDLKNFGIEFAVNQLSSNGYSFVFLCLYFWYLRRGEADKNMELKAFNDRNIGRTSTSISE